MIVQRTPKVLEGLLYSQQTSMERVLEEQDTTVVVAMVAVFRLVKQMEALLTASVMKPDRMEEMSLIRMETLFLLEEMVVAESSSTPMSSTLMEQLQLLVKMENRVTVTTTGLETVAQVLAVDLAVASL